MSGLGMRRQLFEAVKQHANNQGRVVDDPTWTLIEECHGLRNGLAHERPNEDVPPDHIKDYYDAALRFLNTLFDLELEQAVTILQMAALIPPDVADQSPRGLGQSQIRGLMFAMQEYYAGQLDDAISRLSQLINETETPEAHYLMALCYKRKGRAHWEAAVREIEHAAAGIPGEPAIQLEKADLIGRINRPLDSLTAIEGAESQGLDNLQTLQATMLKARALRGVCRFPEALDCYRNAHELALRYGTARTAVDGLIEVLINLGQSDEAKTLVNSLIEHQPRYAYAYVLRARLHAQTGDTQRGLADLDEAWSISTAKGGKGDNRVHYTRASIYLDRYFHHRSAEDLSAAEKVLLEALPTIPPGFKPRFRNLLVHVHWEQERHDDAYQEASRSVEENRLEERNYQYLAFAALSVARWPTAREASANGLKLAEQLVDPRVLCGAAHLIANAFCGRITDVQIEHNRWVTFVESQKGYRPEHFRWEPVRKRITAELSKAQQATRSIVNDVLDRL